ncbi:hypothetical protein MVLG_02635 [Microbotryum lychnidis-dioicae p1A1 Lamole]|uniref:Fe2OG dioxygenase domain-containing protein n=1 Tax=Microbotryum lychnidis-dioicae (strain p1A1 Lamole / MvSl-1064) TaxID=683840 RepID=U5H5S0_USTV1|nr:hypothetical protein MVLG_02635 [Microbotryum lychnidis-dioicae p1A1 Lamole]|eukprot:KDE07059.1 hypothetical protein MVLG_02635 [Microbotryum lychnidis-dioicae p1A1 Lamole]
MPPAARAVFPIEPFPSDLETHPLLVVDYTKIASRDQAEIDQLYKACTSIGFFYLKNHGVDPEPMFAVGEDTFDLPLDYLDQFEQGDSGMSAGFKRAGASNVDAKGNTDTVMFMNVNKHDALNFPDVYQRTYPSTCVDNMATIRSFVRQSDTVLKDVMKALESSLELPEGTFDKLHTDKEVSGSEVRVIKKAVPGEAGYRAEGVGENNEPAAAIGAHTDFGSLSMLHSRGTGGLQVLTPGASKWVHIKPLAGHAVVNVGDTLSVYTGGIFRSNIHRVIPPPPPQDKYTRWSLVYFIRPTFEAALFPLSDLSPKIARVAEENPAMKAIEPGQTAGSWFKRRVSNQRTANRKGPETWTQSRGTEHTPTAA